MKWFWEVSEFVFSHKFSTFSGGGSLDATCHQILTTLPQKVEGWSGSGDRYWVEQPGNSILISMFDCLFIGRI